MSFRLFLFAASLSIGSTLYGQLVKTVSCIGLTADEKARITSKISRYYASLSKLKEANDETFGSDLRSQNGHVLFSWPLKVSSEYDMIPNYYNTTNYWDMDRVSSGTLDWNCSTKTYNGHNGTDISSWPFWWHMKNKDYVYAAAAASGVVIDVDVSHLNDNNCTLQSIPANVVTVMHSDSSITSYLHLKANIAFVAEGQLVSEGQVLAVIGSSGRTSNPHLHFQVADKDGNDIEPYTGANPATDCNTFNNDSWWKIQKPHFEPRLNRIMTHYGKFSQFGPDGDSRLFCPEFEQVKAKNNFSAGDSIYLGIFLSDILTNSDTDYEIIRPNGAIWQSGNFSHAGDPGSYAWYTIAKKLPSNADPGTWKFRVSFRAETETHYFTVGCTPNYNLTLVSGSYGYIAGDFIESISPITGTNKVLLQAGNSIVLKPGFTAGSGTTFKARIKDCNYSE